MNPLLLDPPKRRAPAFRRADARELGRPAGRGDDPTLYHFLVIGQSNATGSYLTASWPTPATLTQYPRSLRHLMFSSGVRVGAPGGTASAVHTGLTSLAPLYEQDDGVNHAETCWSSFAYELSRRAGGKTVLVSSCAVDGTAYSGLAKGTVPYAQGLEDVKAARNYAAGRGLPYRVAGLLCVHGETDAGSNRTDYVTNLPLWQQNFQQDIQAITGQADPILLFFCQQEDFNPTFQLLVALTTTVTQQQYLVWLNNQRTHVLLGPKCQYQYNSDGIHLAPGSMRWHGAQYGKVVFQTLFGKGPFKPLNMTAATLSGSTITVNCQVPVPPLVLDRTLVMDTGTIPIGSGATTNRTLKAVSAAVVAGGTSGYAVNDTVTLTGGTFTTAIVLTVTTVSSGVITGVNVTTAGSYTVLPANPVSQGSTSGSGAGVPTFTVTWGLGTITANATGFNYPAGTTVSVTAGGGSGATATASTISASGGITAYTVTAAGTGFTSLPTVTITSPTLIAGFTFLDDSGAAPAITSVAVAASGVDLTIGLSGAPSGGSKVLRQGWGTTIDGSGSYLCTARGNVRDSDPEQSVDGCPLFNWMCHQEIAVT